MGGRTTTKAAPRRRGLLVLLGAVGLAVAALAIAWASGALGSGAGEQDLASRTAALQEAERDRDQENIVTLSVYAQETQRRLVPVLAEMYEVMPTDGSDGLAPREAQLDGWASQLSQLAQDADRLPTGSTENNIARTGFQESLRLLESSVGALRLSGEVEGEAAQESRELAYVLRASGVQIWSLAAMQLDTLSIESGNGHLHVYLPLRPGDALDGGLDELHEDEDDGHGH